MTMTIKDEKGFTHELEVKKVEGEQATVHMHGNNIKLMSRLQMIVQLVNADSTNLF